MTYRKGKRLQEIYNRYIYSLENPGDNIKFRIEGSDNDNRC